MIARLDTIAAKTRLTVTIMSTALTVIHEAMSSKTLPGLLGMGSMALNGGYMGLLRGQLRGPGM